MASLNLLWGNSRSPSLLGLSKVTLERTSGRAGLIAGIKTNFIPSPTNSTALDTRLEAGGWQQVAEQDVTTTVIPVGPVERGLVFFVM